MRSSSGLNPFQYKSAVASIGKSRKNAVLVLIILKKGAGEQRKNRIEMMMALEKKELQQQQRFVYEEKYFASICYRGSIEGMSGEWIGIEWDDVEKGKHSGCHNGIEYFKPR